MKSTYYTTVKDMIKHRITIKNDTWNKLELKKGDNIKVTIEKLED